MAKLAACPNVHMKISGFGSRVFGFGFDERQQPPSSKELADAIEPYVKTALEPWRHVTFCTFLSLLVFHHYYFLISNNHNMCFAGIICVFFCRRSY